MIRYPEKWKKISKFNFSSSSILKDFLFLRLEIFGYRNKVAVLPRILQATIIASLVTIFLLATMTFLKSYIHDKSFSDYLLIVMKKKLSWPLLTFWGSVFTFVAALEIGSYYQKWKYLSDLFNSIIKIEPKEFWENGEKKYSQREHLAACLAMDIVCLEMWNHRSFFPFLKETIEKAVFVKSEFDIGVFQHNPDALADGSSINQLKEYLISFIDWNRPKQDLIGSLIK